MNRIDRMYVAPEFKKLIKEKAIASDKTVIEWTKEFMDKSDPLHPLTQKKKVKGFDFV